MATVETSSIGLGRPAVNIFQNIDAIYFFIQFFYVK